MVELRPVGRDVADLAAGVVLTLDESTVGHDRSADAGPDRDGDEVVHATGLATPGVGQRGQVHVVVHEDRNVDGIAQASHHVEVLPVDPRPGQRASGYRIDDGWHADRDRRNGHLPLGGDPAQVRDDREDRGKCLPGRAARPLVLDQDLAREVRQGAVAASPPAKVNRHHAARQPIEHDAAAGAAAGAAGRARLADHALPDEPGDQAAHGRRAEPQRVRDLRAGRLLEIPDQVQDQELVDLEHGRLPKCHGSSFLTGNKLSRESTRRVHPARTGQRCPRTTAGLSPRRTPPVSRHPPIALSRGEIAAPLTRYAHDRGPDQTPDPGRTEVTRCSRRHPKATSLRQVLR